MTHPAIQFLQVLDPSPDARFIIEAYTDVPKGGTKPKPDQLAMQFRNKSHEDAERLLHTLDGLNHRGAGIFVAVNEFDHHRRHNEISRVRGVHADLDDVDEKTLNTLRSMLKPTIEVCTSGPRNWHFYWLLDERETMLPELARKINRTLATLGADPAAVDITRLLRLPGFVHMKGSNKEVNDA